MHIVFRESRGLEEIATPRDIGQDPADLPAPRLDRVPATRQPLHEVVGEADADRASVERDGRGRGFF